MLALVISLLLPQTPIFESRSMLPPAAPELTVYVFTTTDSPISTSDAPEVKRLAAKFKSKAAFVLVYAARTDTPKMIREHHQKFAPSIQFIRDADQSLTNLTGARAAEVAMLQGSTILYRGPVGDLEAALQSATTAK